MGEFLQAGQNIYSHQTFYTSHFSICGNPACFILVFYTRKQNENVNSFLCTSKQKEDIQKLDISVTLKTHSWYWKCSMIQSWQGKIQFSLCRWWKGNFEPHWVGMPFPQLLIRQKWATAGSCVVFYGYLLSINNSLQSHQPGKISARRDRWRDFLCWTSKTTVRSILLLTALQSHSEAVEKDPALLNMQGNFISTLTGV